MKTIRVAIEGCCHGQLNKIYSSLPKNIELLIICGDFQAIRNQQDLKSINVPSKYKELGDFKDYYLGKKNAPVMTIFIGGNHESSLYLRELQYGGWVAPSIYYLGEYGTVWYKGLRILGLSGIFNYTSFIGAKSKSPPSYTLPYDNSTIRSIYHVKPKSFLKLLLSQTSDVVVSHDWPKGIWEWGNQQKLLKKKPFLKADIENGRLGSPLAMEALNYLKPSHWFSLHMHTLFEGTVQHGKPEQIQPKRRKMDDLKQKKTDPGEISVDMDDMDDMDDLDASKNNKDEISLDMGGMGIPGSPESGKNGTGTASEVDKSSNEESKSENDDKTTETSSPASPQKEKTRDVFKIPPSSETQFLALDKCLPKRDFLAVRHIKTDPKHPSFKAKSLYYDPRGIAINRVVEKFARSPNWEQVQAHDMLQVEKIANLLDELNTMVEYEVSQISGNLKIASNFRKVAPDVKEQVVPLQYWPNNQTKEYCEKWMIPEPDLDGP